MEKAARWAALEDADEGKVASMGSKDRLRQRKQMDEGIVGIYAV